MKLHNGRYIVIRQYFGISPETTPRLSVGLATIINNKATFNLPGPRGKELHIEDLADNGYEGHSYDTNKWWTFIPLDELGLMERSDETR